MFDLIWQAVGTFGEGVLGTVSGVVAFGIGLLADLILTLAAALPEDPFDLPVVAGQWEQGLAWLNWWLPIGQIAALLAAWAVAQLAYLSFSVILKKLGGL